MRLQSEKTRSYSLYMLLFFTAVLLLERILVPFYSYSLVTCIIGIISICLFFYFAELSLLKIGITFKPEQLMPAVLHGFLLPIVSIAVVLLGEQLVWMHQGQSGLFFSIGRDLHYANAWDSSLSYVSIPGFMKWALAGVLISLIRSVFYEFGFRGYFYYDMGEHFSYTHSNLLQALGYAVMAGLPSVVALLVNYKRGAMDNSPDWALPVLIFVTVANLFLLGLRQGSLRSLTGSVWVCVICFFIFDYFNAMFNSAAILPSYLAPYAVLFRSLAVQIVASLLNIPGIAKCRKKTSSQYVPTETREVDVDKIVEDILRHDRLEQEEYYGR